MLDNVFSAKERSFVEIRHVAIAIRAIDSGQRHVGVLHNDESSGQLKLLHLAWHHDLKNSEPKVAYFWIEPAIHQARARQVAAMCRKILRSNEAKGIPYAFSPPNDCFSTETGDYLLGPYNFGLTCATFVLAIFDAAGIRLINQETWRSRADDESWQNKIIQQLEADGADKKHIDAVRMQVGSMRYRPEDVAGAAASGPPPAEFQQANSLGEKIVEKLNSTSQRESL